MTLRMRSTRWRRRLASVAMSVLLLHCSMEPCRLGSPDVLRMPVETNFVSEAGSVHRIQGIYRAAFELSGKISVLYSQPVEELGYFNGTDFCASVVSDQCYGDLKSGTKAIGSFAHKFWYFGFVDVIVRYDGPAPAADGCPFGRVTILHIIQANPIARSMPPK
jgi:hypothetical protein